MFKLILAYSSAVGKTYVKLSVLAGMITFLFANVCIGQASITPRKFLKFLNENEVDSLRSVISEDFMFSRTFVGYSNDYSNFLGQYINLQKEYEGSFIVKEELNHSNPVSWLVEDRSAYLECLGIPFPIWKMSIEVLDEKISRVELDTVPGFYLYQQKLMNADAAFVSWLSRNYSNVNYGDLLRTPGLFMKRVREFAECE